MIQTILHTSHVLVLKNLQKSSQKFKNYTYTQLNKLAFIPKRFSDKSTKTSFGGWTVPDNLNE